MDAFEFCLNTGTYDLIYCKDDSGETLEIQVLEDPDHPFIKKGDCHLSSLIDWYGKYWPVCDEIEELKRIKDIEEQDKIITELYATLEMISWTYF